MSPSGGWSTAKQETRLQFPPFGLNKGQPVADRRAHERDSLLNATIERKLRSLTQKIPQ
jgi:hypothetical protein